MYYNWGKWMRKLKHFKAIHKPENKEIQSTLSGCKAVKITCCLKVVLLGQSHQEGWGTSR